MSHAIEVLPAAERSLRKIHGDYRIMDTFEDDVLRVIVVRLGHRRDVYR